MKNWKDSDWQYEHLVKQWPDPWTKDWFKVYWATFPLIGFVFAATFGNFIGDLFWDKPLFGALPGWFGWVFFLFAILMGLLWRHNKRIWMKRQILNYKKRNLIL